MGAVWQATNVLIDLPVAIKLIRAGLDRATLRARLQLEARSAAKLGHPGIVRVFDVGETEFGDPFIVMELLQGETLAQLLTRGPLSPVRAVQLVLPIIDALGVAHARGIVHRDLKPDNVMLAVEQQRLQPKILDFGIAKFTHPHDLGSRLTEIGTLVGSPDYMSPEQARGSDDVDPGSDVWSICVVLYEAVTGAVPFSASNYNALLRAILEDAPNPAPAREAGDAALWSIIERGLAKERSQRYADMRELGRALATWLLSHGVGEDACGTSLEANWLGREREPALAQTPIPSRAISASFEGHSRESNSELRGPFTATVRPSGASTRALSVVVAVCTLLTVVAIVWSGASKQAAGRSTAALTPSASGTPPNSARQTVTPTAERPPAADRASEPANVPLRAPTAVAKVVEHPASPLNAGSSGTARERGQPAARVSNDARRISAIPVAPAKVLPSASSAPPTAKSKPLDLLSPY